MKIIEVKNPVLKKGVHYLTQDYKTREKNSHNGMDMIGKGKAVDEIIAIDNGVVSYSGYSKTAGYYVEIKHDNNLISRYLHMKKGTVKVKKKDVIIKGQLIGTMGNTGNSTGAHLHFAVYDTKRNALDPLPYLQGKLNFNSDYFRDFVMGVQTSFGAQVDGIAGPETLSKTITISAKANRKHQVVKYLQSYLNALGYSEVGAVDGIAGPKFTKAIKQFQKDNNCVVDGVITKQNKTWKKLLKLL